ncbi:MAG TPA: hypothetical protein VGD81_10455 [Opitutaceae bacterium]
MKQKRLTERDGLGMLYYAMREDGVPFPVPMRMATIVRAAQSPEALVPELRRALAEIDPTLALDDVKPMTTRVQETLTLPRAMMLLGGVFAAVAGRLDFIDFSDAKLSRGIVGPKADHPRSSTKVLNPPPRIVQRFIVAWLMRILRETIQQIAHLTLVPLLKRKQIGQRLPGRTGSNGVSLATAPLGKIAQSRLLSGVHLLHQPRCLLTSGRRLVLQPQ